MLIISVKSVEERIVVCLMELILVEVVTWGVVAVVFVAGASWPVRVWVVVSEVVVEVVGVVVIILIF